MKNEISRNELLDLLANRIPEAQREFSLLADQINVSAILDKFFDVTAILTVSISLEPLNGVCWQLKNY